MTNPTRKPCKQSLWKGLRFKIKNFVAGRIHRVAFNTALWFKVKARRREAAKYDPVWKESWWCLERRYTKLAKRFTRLELRYLKQKDELRRIRDENRNGR